MTEAKKGTGRKRSWLWWLLGYGAACASAVLLVYYWRVFYSFDRLSAVKTTLLALLGVTLLYGAVYATAHRIKKMEWKAFVAVLACGVLFCFANPPLQTPDEASHFLRAYAVSLGRFDFDADRGYPADVDVLLECFPGAYTNGNNGSPIKQYYHLKNASDKDSEKLPDRFCWIGDSFADYRAGLQTLAAGGAGDAKKVTEPLVVMVLPYLPQAAGILAARLLGFHALGAMYAGRLANLLCYAFLCLLAMRNLTRHRPVFLALMLLPLSLYLGASLSYDSLLLGLYWLSASFIFKKEFTQTDIVRFSVCIALINLAKPWINLLWLAVYFLIPKESWKARMKRLSAVGLTAAAALAATGLGTLYGQLLRRNYGVIERMLGDAVQPVPQLLFILRNPLRYLAVLFGTAYENNFFLTELGNFGALDTMVPVVSLVSLALLALGTALSVPRERLGTRTGWGLAGFSVLYIVGVMTAMYITYTPVGMVRVIGLQARYFLPAALALCVLLAEVLGRALTPRRAEGPASTIVLYAGWAVGALSALWLCEAYFIGPVAWVLSETV